MASKNFIKCEYCGRKVKRSNLLKHKARVHPKQLSEGEKDALKVRKRAEYKTFWETWSGLPGEATAEVKGLKASGIEEHVERAALLEWMKKTLFDDPYWIKPTRGIGDEEFNAWLKKLEKFEKKHSTWVTHLESGMPTYYGILGATRSTSPKTIEQNYHMKIENSSSYPIETLDEALVTLRNEKLKKKYNSLLKIINQLNRGLNKKERAKTIAEHDSWMKHENAVMIMHYITREHYGWENAFMLGAPPFYDIAGINGWKKEKIDGKKIEAAIGSRKDAYPHAGDLLDKIRDIFQNPILRWEYDFMVGFLERQMEDGDMDEVEPRRDGWKIWDDKSSFLVYLLVEKNAGENFNKWLKIIQKYNDWEKFLPPNVRSFYTILGINRGRIPSAKGTFASFLRTHYRQCDRTPEVNYAYTVLKNRNLRKDYDWMMKNQGAMRQMQELYELGDEDVGEEEMTEMMERIFWEKIGRFSHNPLE